jgi:hypothetical protein
VCSGAGGGGARHKGQGRGTTTVTADIITITIIIIITYMISPTNSVNNQIHLNKTTYDERKVLFQAL